jgi:SAM-dependent methyltransferase
MDIIGKAIHNYHFNQDYSYLRIDSNYTEDEELDPAHFFRNKDAMNLLEIRALELCRGKILDVGAGAGCHALELQRANFDVTAIEISGQAAAVMTDRGVKNVVSGDIMQYSGFRYDTVLLLMNGSGIAGTLSGLNDLLGHLATLLEPDGQLLMDSTDISYLFEEDDGSLWIDLANAAYFGEMKYTVSTKGLSSESFPWLFVDINTLSSVAECHGFQTEKILEGNEGSYLARLTKNNR